MSGRSRQLFSGGSKTKSSRGKGHAGAKRMSAVPKAVEILTKNPKVSGSMRRMVDFNPERDMRMLQSNHRNKVEHNNLHAHELDAMHRPGHAEGMRNHAYAQVDANPYYNGQESDVPSAGTNPVQSVPARLAILNYPAGPRNGAHGRGRMQAGFRQEMDALSHNPNVGMPPRIPNGAKPPPFETKWMSPADDHSVDF